MMPPELSRRVARAASQVEIPLEDRLRLGPACEGAETFDDLPDWVRDIVTRAEAGTAGEEEA